MTWMPSFDLVCQSLHVVGGFAIVLAVGRFWPWWAGLVILTSWVLSKEFAFDLIKEGDSFLSSLFDAAMYYVGGFLAAGLLLFAEWLEKG